MFQNEASMRNLNAGNSVLPSGNAIIGSDLLNPVQCNPLLPAFGVGQPLNYLQGETTGLDMEFQVGLTMDRAGAVRLGLQLTRILDASYEAGAGYSSGAEYGIQKWALASPVNRARLGLDWNKGNFSSGIQGFYREQIDFLNREDLDSVTTFDVHFTWRAPWNASLSVGANNVLSAGNDEGNINDNRLQDPFESIYGRIPYVRYKQDL
jgi:iron complex outermembrane receptor protein